MTEEEIENRRNGWLLDTGRTHRLTVRIRSGAKLQNYGDWLRANRDVVIIKKAGWHRPTMTVNYMPSPHLAEAIT